MAKASLKKEVLAFIEKGKYPKRKGGRMTLATDAGEVKVTRTGEEVVVYAFPDAGRQVTVTLGDTPTMKESKYAAPEAAPDAVPETATLKPIAKAVKEPKEPVMVEQKDERGEVEQVDFNVYSNPITCIDCGEIRYVKNSDRHQVVRCKLHARRFRRRKIRESRKLRGVGKKSSKTFIEKKVAEKAK